MTKEEKELEIKLAVDAIVEMVKLEPQSTDDELKQTLRENGFSDEHLIVDILMKAKDILKPESVKTYSEKEVTPVLTDKLGSGSQGAEYVVPEKKPLSVFEMPAPSDQYIRQAEQEGLTFMNPKRLQMMEVMSKVWHQSGALPRSIANAPQLMMILQAGYETGLKPIESINSFYIVNGKIAMYGDTVIAQVKKAGHKVTWGKCDENQAEVTITRGDTGESMTETFTILEAKQASLTLKDPWIKFPKRMLKYKAFAEVAHFLVPDALHGIPIKEDLEGAIEEVALKKGPNIAPDTSVATEGHKPLGEIINEKKK